jgi:hypothetical protein
MSKILKITDGDYKVKTGYAGTITLDTGVEAGQVIVTGALNVLGDFTTINSETLTIRDQLIELNVGESGPGITSKPTDTSKTSGILIHRGSGLDDNGIASSDVKIVFDEAVQHFDPVTVTNKKGTLIFKYNDGRLLGIRTNSIDTNGGNLGLINKGNGYVTVSGTSNYELHAFNYSAWNTAGNPRPLYAAGAGLITVVDDDVIPNAKGLVDYVDSSLYYYRTPLISEGDTTVRTYDDSVSGGASRIEFKVNNSLRGKFIDTGLDVDYVNIFTNTINNSTNNLILTSTTATKIVEVDAVLQLDDKSLSPTAVSGATKIYTVNSNTTPAPGKTGIYFTNQGNSDELVAKNRALLFSILF